MKNLKLVWPFIPFALLSVLFLWVVAPSLTHSFAYNDDYLYFQDDLRALPFFHAQFSFFFLSGRFLYNVASWILSLFLWRMTDFTIARWAAYLFSLGLAWLIYSDLRLARIRDEVAACFVFLVLCLPGLLMHLIWVTMIPFYLSMFAAYFAAGLLFNERQEKKKLMIGAVGLLLTSLFIYQPGAMLFLLAGSLKTLRDLANIEFVKRKLSLCLKVFTGSCIGYFILQKFAVLPLLFWFRPAWRDEYLNLGQFKFALNSGIFDRVTQSVPAVFYSIFSMWNIEQNRWVIGTVLVVLLAGLSVCLRSPGYRLWVLASAAAAFGSVSPSLVSDGHLGFRVLFSGCSLILLIILSSITKLSNSRWLAVPLSILCCVVAFYSRGLMTRTVENAVWEFDVLKKNLAAVDLAKTPNLKIYSIPPRETLSYLGDRTRGVGEFFYNSGSNWAINAWQIRAAFIDSGVSRDDLLVTNEMTESRQATGALPRYRVEVVARGTDIEKVPANAHVVDFNSFYQ